MTRINLLPPEILERRKAEKRFGLVGLVAFVLLLALVGVYSFAAFNVQTKEDELALVQQQVRTTQAQADQLAIFEERSSELQTRRETAELALSNREDWNKLFQNMSLVLPADVWVQTMAADEVEGLQIAGYAIDSASDSPDLGHKTIAKMLVRLADLDQLQDVWLTNSTKAEFEDQDAIQFTVTAGLTSRAGESEAQ